MNEPITIAGAGAFGTALAITLAKAGKDVTLVGRNTAHWVHAQENPRLPGFFLPKILKSTDQLTLTTDTLLLLAIPTQALDGYLSGKILRPKAAIACCKGIERATGRGPADILRDHVDAPAIGVLTGPSFAADIAKGLPTALTLALPNGTQIQQALSTDSLRLYLSDDVTGAQLGGALKNVIAIACGLCIGAGLGESARAALMTRGYAEMQRLALKLGAQPETLAGLSGFGDLALTCTSPQSRNYAFGYALGAGQTAPDATTEGRATARAAVTLAEDHGIDMPIASAVAGVVDGAITLPEALAHLLSRPLTTE